MANLIDTINKKVTTTTNSMYGNPSVPPVQQPVAPIQGPQPLVGPVKPQVVAPVTPKITPTITPPIDATITADKLKGTTSYILPEKTIDDSPSKVGTIVDQFKNGQNMSYEQGLTDIKNKYNNTNEVTDLMKQISGIESTQTDEANKLKAQENLQAYKKYTTDIDLENERTRQAVEDIQKNNPQGALRGGQSDLINNLQRESGNRLAILTIQRSAALGDYNTAIETAKAKVDMQLAPLKAQLEQLKYVQDYNKDFQTAEINMLAKKKENEIKREEERLTKGEEMIINAQMQKAPSSLVTKAREILENGGTKADVTSILGDYSMSPADKLDLEIKRLTKTEKGLDIQKKELENGVNGGLKKLDDTQYSKFTTNSNYKAVQDGGKFLKALDDFKKATEKWGTAERLNAKGRGELNSAYKSVVALTKDYYTLGTLDAGVEKLVSLGIEKPGTYSTRDNIVLSAIDTEKKQVLNSINNSANQLKNSVYGNSTELQSLLNESLPKEDSTMTAEEYTDKALEAVQEVNNPFSVYNTKSLDK